LYGNVRRSHKYIVRLHDYIYREYQIRSNALTPAKRGYYGETWRLETATKNYFIKLDYSPHKEIYKHSFPVMEHLRKHGIDCISRIVKNVNGEFFGDFESAVIGVFEWIDGENIQDEQTKIEEYNILGKVYTVPINGIRIKRDIFSTAQADLFYRLWNKLKRDSSNKNSAIISSVFERHSGEIKHCAERLALFADRCKPDKSHFYITHGDAGGNVIVNDGKFYMVDWDDPRIAPPERDAWFCMHWNWAVATFNQALKNNGIDYSLRIERMAYYCYYYFFFYLTEFLHTYFDLGKRKVADEISKYFNCWIMDNIRYDDNIKL